MPSRPRAILFLLLALLSVSAHAQTTLNVGYMPILPVAQLFVMEGEAWPEEADLELQLTRFSDGPAMVQALASGQLDVAYFGIGPAMVSRARGIPIKVVAAAVKEQIGVIVQGDLASALESADSVAAGIASFTEAQGRKPVLATFPRGSVPDTVLRYWLSEVLKLPADAVEIKGMGASQVQQALLAGQVDGASILEPILTVVQERVPEARVIARGGELLPNQPGAVVAVTENALAEHRGAIQQLVALHVRATDMLRNDATRAAPHVRSFVGERLIALETVERALSAPTSNYLADPREIREATVLMHDFQVADGTLKQPVPLDELFDFSIFEAVEAGQ